MIKADIRKLLEIEHGRCLERMRYRKQVYAKNWADSSRQARETIADHLKASAGGFIIHCGPTSQGLQSAVELLDALIQSMHTIGYGPERYDEPLWEPAEAAADPGREFMAKIAYVCEQFPRSDCCFRQVSWSLPLAVVRVTQFSTTNFPLFPLALEHYHNEEHPHYGQFLTPAPQSGRPLKSPGLVGS